MTSLGWHTYSNFNTLPQRAKDFICEETGYYVDEVAQSNKVLCFSTINRSGGVTITKRSPIRNVDIELTELEVMRIITAMQISKTSASTLLKGIRR